MPRLSKRSSAHGMPSKDPYQTNPLVGGSGKPSVIGSGIGPQHLKSVDRPLRTSSENAYRQAYAIRPKKFLGLRCSSAAQKYGIHKHPAVNAEPFIRHRRVVRLMLMCAAAPFVPSTRAPLGFRESTISSRSFLAYSSNVDPLASQIRSVCNSMTEFVVVGINFSEVTERSFQKPATRQNHGPFDKVFQFANFRRPVPLR